MPGPNSNASRLCVSPIITAVQSIISSYHPAIIAVSVSAGGRAEARAEGAEGEERSEEAGHQAHHERAPAEHRRHEQRRRHQRLRRRRQQRGGECRRRPFARRDLAEGVREGLLRQLQEPRRVRGIGSFQLSVHNRWTVDELGAGVGVYCSPAVHGPVVSSIRATFSFSVSIGFRSARACNPEPEPESRANNEQRTRTASDRTLALFLFCASVSASAS